MSKNPLETILRGLQTAPIGQLVPFWTRKFKRFKGTQEELLVLFEELYQTDDTISSKFVRTLVNPEYTRKYIK